MYLAHKKGDVLERRLFIGPGIGSVQTERNVQEKFTKADLVFQKSYLHFLFQAFFTGLGDQLFHLLLCHIDHVLFSILYRKE